MRQISHAGHVGDNAPEFGFRKNHVSALSASRFNIFDSSASTTVSQPVLTVSGANSSGVQQGNRGQNYQNDAPVYNGVKQLYLNSAPVLTAGKNLITGTELSAGKDLTITNATDLGAIDKAFTFAGSALATVQSNAASAGVGANQVTDLLRAQLANQNNVASGGAATSSKTFLITLAIMAGVALLGLLAWKGKKA